MTELREFVAEQVKRFQDQLHELFFVNPEENREDVVLPLNFCDIRDNPTISELG